MWTEQIPRLRRATRGLLFVLLSTSVMVFFSEKAYWYMQGYAMVGLVVYYAIPTAACLWAVNHFRIIDLSGIVLVGALYAFLVEGILTPVIYESGLLDPVMPAYFIGWHGLLSAVFGWYLIRKWLVEKRWKRLLTVSLLFGFLWGVWSLTQWLPENIAEFEALALAGEPVRPGKWPPYEFAGYAFLFTLLLMTGHWLLGQGSWKAEFRLSGPVKWVILLSLAGLFGLTVFPIQPLAVFKLFVLLGLVLIPLELQRRVKSPGSVLAKLQGQVKAYETLPLLAMPAAASLVYWMVFVSDPGNEAIQSINDFMPFIQALVGCGFYLWAAGRQISLARSQRRNSSTP